MITYTPVEYAETIYGGAVTSKTVRNWIKSGKKLKGVSYVETTPTGHYIIFMEEDAKSNAASLFEMMKAKAA
jgi:hypothetical protein